MITSDSFVNGGGKPQPDKVKAKKEPKAKAKEVAVPVVAAPVVEEVIAPKAAELPPEPLEVKAVPEPEDLDSYLYADRLCTRFGDLYNKRGQRRPGSGYR